jgi:hypothetical protein
MLFQDNLIQYQLTVIVMVMDVVHEAVTVELAVSVCVDNVGLRVAVELPVHEDICARLSCHERSYEPGHNEPARMLETESMFASASVWQYLKVLLWDCRLQTASHRINSK